jgi:RNA polymerase sigma-70 factor (ECF subfamily)
MKVIEIPTDADLVIALNRGDRQAFEMIYRKYVSDLYRYARKNISVKEDCEEIIQEVFESLWSRHRTLQVNSLRFYLLSMVKYKVIRYFQHNIVKRKYAEHYKAFDLVYNVQGNDTAGPEAIHALIDTSIKELPERCQAAFRLRLHENLSNGEIASRLNITKKTVEVYMFQAFSHFRASYQKLCKAG